jgi:hypothetical protein
LFDIFIDDLVAGLHDTCSEHGICMGQTDVASLLYATMRMHYPSPQWLAKVDGSTPGSTNGGCKEFHQKQGDGISP